DRAAPRVSQPLDLAGRSRRFSRLSAQLVVEYPLRLAILAVDAQHPRRRARPGAGTISIFLSASAGFQSFECALLAGGTIRFAFLGPPSALPRARLGLSRFLCSLFRSARKELLPRAHLSHALC